MHYLRYSVLRPTLSNQISNRARHLRLISLALFFTAFSAEVIAEGKKDFKGVELLRWSGLALEMLNSGQLGNISQLLAQAKLQAPEKGALAIAKIAEKSARMLRKFRQP